LAGSGNAQLSNVKINDSTARSMGGGIYTLKQINISGLNIENAKATTNFGGGIYSEHSLIIGGLPTVIKDVSANEGGAIYLNSSLSSSISSLTIDNAYANRSAGGIFSRGSINISNSTIRKADANQNGGGGLYINSSSSPSININNTLFEDCISDYGGAVLIVSGSGAAVIINSQFINCSAKNNGKIIFCNQGSSLIMEVKNCEFTHTDSLRDTGIETSGFGSVLFYNGYFEGCTFNNLITNELTTPEIYLFGNRRRGNNSNHVWSEVFVLTLKDCIFNFKNTGKLGLIGMDNDNLGNYLMIDNVTINNYNGLQPLIWLYSYSSQKPSDIFKFTRNNVYNGILLDTQQKIINLGSNVVRLDGGAVPTMVP